MTHHHKWPNCGHNDPKLFFNFPRKRIMSRLSLPYFTARKLPAPSQRLTSGPLSNQYCARLIEQDPCDNVQSTKGHKSTVS
jgi:hypothetical protein